MKTYRNDQFIQRRAKIGRYTFFGGAGVLIVGLIISITSPEWIGVSFLSLIVGFILTQISIFYGARYARLERPDEVLAKALKGFDDRYTLFQYATPAGNVLITPNACCVFVIKMQAGAITYKAGRWKHHISGVKRFFFFFNQDSLGNPAREAAIEADALRKYVAKKLPDVELPIQPVIIFGHEKAAVDTSESPLPAMHAKKLKDWLRGPGKAGGLGPTARDQLIDLFEPENYPTTAEDTTK